MSKQNDWVKKYVDEKISISQQEEFDIDKYFKQIEVVLGQYGFDGLFITGSVGRKTVITPMNDIDIICPIKGNINLDTFDLRETNQIKDIIECLGIYFGNQNIKIQSHSISILIEKENNGEGFSIDIVPAVKLLDEKKEDSNYCLYKVPSNLLKTHHKNRKEFYEKVEKKEKNIKWEKTDPRGYIFESNLVDRFNKNYRLATKFIKKWRYIRKLEYSNKVFIKSFHIEEHIKKFAKQNPTTGLIDLILTINSINLNDSVIPNRAEPNDKEKNIDYYLVDNNDFKENKNKIKDDIKSFVSILSKLKNLETKEEVYDLLDELLDENYKPTAFKPYPPHSKRKENHKPITYISITDEDKEILEELNLSEDEKKFLLKKGFRITEKVIKGTYSFAGYYSKENNLLIPEYKEEKYYIKDSYEVEICKISGKYSVRYIGSKIIKDYNNHISQNGSCCLGVFADYKITIMELFNKRMFSYFYGTSFKQKFGRYPFGELSHFEDGIFEQIKNEKNKTNCMKIFENNFPREQYRKMLNYTGKFKTKESKEGYEKIRKIYFSNPLFYNI